jgi:signal transduction histidine kinase
MLSVSEIEAGSLSLKNDDVRIAELMADLESDFRGPAQEKGLRLVFELPPKLPVLQGDRDKIMLALHNLIGNAVKYTLEGQVVVSVHHAGGQLVVEVRDTGIGIAEIDQAKLFEKFYRAPDPRVAKIVGSGLGLALAREVARRHGGDITVQSQPEKGSAFTLTLPAPAEAA